MVHAVQIAAIVASVSLIMLSAVGVQLIAFLELDELREMGVQLHRAAEEEKVTDPANATEPLPSRCKRADHGLVIFELAQVTGT